MNDEPQPDPIPTEPTYPHPPELPRGTRNKRLTEDVLNKVVESLRGCSYIVDACAYACIGERTFYEWRERGYRYEEHIEAGGKIIDGEDIYMHFALLTDQARAEARVSAAMHIRKAWEEGNVTAAFKYLAITDPNRWEHVQRVEVSGREGAPIQLEVTDVEERLSRSIKARQLIMEDATTVVEVASTSTVRQIGAADDEYEDYAIPFADIDYEFE